MTEWTVFFQTGDGIQMHVVKADFAAFDDENGRLLFSNLDDKEKFAVFQKASRNSAR
jgi:hypothetical protein